MNAVVAITGIRDLASRSESQLAAAMREVLEEGAAEIRFGGARGADTVALIAAGAWRSQCTSARGGAAGATRPLLRVIVPGLVDDQPADARAAIQKWADDVIELGLNVAHADSYLERNEALLRGATRVLGFTDGSMRGGTAWTIQRAAELGLEVVTVRVRRARPALAGRR